MDSPDYWLDLGEGPGIFAWALQGLARLRQQRDFSHSAICNQAGEQNRRDCNPAAQFLHEACQVDRHRQILVQEVYQRYRQWAVENGYHPVASNRFGQEVFRVFPMCERIQGREGGQRTWSYRGITWIP